MLHLLRTNLFRILKDKRLFIIVAFHLALFVVVSNSLFTLPEIEYTGVGPTLAYVTDRTREEVETSYVTDYLGGIDILVVTLIYAMFFVTDDKRDKGFENMCTIYKSRSKIFISNYIMLCFTEIIFGFFKIAGFMVLNIAYGNKVGLVSEQFNPIGLIVWFVLFTAYIAFFYSLYVWTRNIYFPIVALFTPLTITFCGRFMEEIPFGTSLLTYSSLFLALPAKSLNVCEWSMACHLVVPSIAVVAVTLVISCIVLEKRDVK